MRLSSLYLGQEPPSAQVAWGFCFSNGGASIAAGQKTRADMPGLIEAMQHHL
jgi:hypothetical protein